MSSRIFFRRTYLLLCVCLAITLLLPGVSQAARTLKHTDHDPSGSLRTDFYRNVYLEEIAKQTNGRVRVQSFWGGALLSATESLQGVADGVSDMAHIFADWYPNQLLLHQGFKVLPSGPASYAKIHKFFVEVYKQIPEFAEELNRFNQRPIFISAGLPAAFASNKPLPDLKALEGNKWRASSRWHLMFLKQAGATAVFIPWSETYMALQSGAIDGCFTNIDGMHMQKIDEAAPNILATRELWWATPFVITINNDVWNSLSKEDQAGFIRAGEICTERYAKEVFETGLNQIVEAQKKAGFNVRYLTKDEVAYWDKTAADVGALDIWRDELKKANVKNADEIVTRFVALYQQILDEDRQ